MENFDTLKGDSPNFQSVLLHAKIIANTDVTVLIKGEPEPEKKSLPRPFRKRAADQSNRSSQ